MFYKIMIFSLVLSCSFIFAKHNNSQKRNAHIVKGFRDSGEALVSGAGAVAAAQMGHIVIGGACAAGAGAKASDAINHFRYAYQLQQQINKGK